MKTAVFKPAKGTASAWDGGRFSETFGFVWKLVYRLGLTQVSVSQALWQFRQPGPEGQEVTCRLIASKAISV